MQPDPAPTSRSRSLLVMLAAVFFGPLLVAAWLYYGSDFRPAGTSNAGVLLEPIENIEDLLSDSALPSLASGQWALLYANDGTCPGECTDGLYRLRQSRLMLGKEMSRVARVFLHGETAPDTVFVTEQHEGLITLTEQGLAQLLDQKRPAYVAAGGIYLFDPLGNLVMYFPPGLDPKEMVGDIKHLLKLSRIG